MKTEKMYYLDIFDKYGKFNEDGTSKSFIDINENLEYKWVQRPEFAGFSREVPDDYTGE